MEAQRQQEGLFYGWIIVAAAFIIIGLGMEPLETAFGWGRGQIAQGILYGWLMYGTFSLVFALLAVFFGVSYGSVMPLYAMVTREFFGARVMGSSYGAIFFLSCIGMGLGAWSGGRFFDSIGTYNLMYILSFTASGIGALLAATLRPPRAPWQPVVPVLAGS